MPETSKTNLSLEDAKKDVEEAIDDGATKLTLKRHDDDKWDITIVKPNAAPTG